MVAPALAAAGAMGKTASAIGTSAGVASRLSKGGSMAWELGHMGVEEKMMMKESQKRLKEISDNTKGSSPLLQQQLLIAKKSFELFLRPIGDFVATLLRPIMLFLYKAAVKWYQLTGTGGKENRGKEELLDAILAKSEQVKELAQAGADPKSAQNELSALVSEYIKKFGNIEDQTVIQAAADAGVAIKKYIKDLEQGIIDAKNKALDELNKKNKVVTDIPKEPVYGPQLPSGGLPSVPMTPPVSMSKTEGAYNGAAWTDLGNKFDYNVQRPQLPVVKIGDINFGGFTQLDTNIASQLLSRQLAFTVTKSMNLSIPGLSTSN